MHARSLIVLCVVAFSLVHAGSALADRPAIAGELTMDSADVRVHCGRR